MNGRVATNRCGSSNSMNCGSGYVGNAFADAKTNADVDAVHHQHAVARGAVNITAAIAKGESTEKTKLRSGELRLIFVELTENERQTRTSNQHCSVANGKEMIVTPGMLLTTASSHTPQLTCAEHTTRSLWWCRRNAQAVRNHPQVQNPTAGRLL